jgi:hypothetical protein
MIRVRRLAARSVRGMREHLPKEIQRAQETPGARCTRSPCALVVAHGSHHRYSGTPGASCAMVLRLTPRSPRRRIRLVTVVGGLKVCCARSGPQNLRRLDTSNGCQDHTASSSATRLRQEASPACARPPKCCRSRKQRRSSARCRSLKGRSTFPAIPSRARRCRVHRIPSRVRDDRDTPLVGDGTVDDRKVIWVRREAEYFCGRGWTENRGSD